MGLHPDTQLPPEFFPRRAATIVVRASDAVDGPVVKRHSDALLVTP